MLTSYVEKETPKICLPFMNAEALNDPFCNGKIFGILHVGCDGGSTFLQPMQYHRGKEGQEFLGYLLRFFLYRVDALLMRRHRIDLKRS
mmetsp:Transcript_19294/g.31438  ORF Transcript_19294/g.31438 Transcript_19294/m.31438 type:complete len:89 (-) Transcript_19294:841-1107(-)